MSKIDYDDQSTEGNNNPQGSSFTAFTWEEYEFISTRLDHWLSEQTTAQSCDSDGVVTCSKVLGKIADTRQWWIASEQYLRERGLLQ